MPNGWNGARPWITFIGSAAVVAALYAAQEIVVPVVLAALLTFVLSPPVAWLEHRLGRVPAVFAVVLVVFAALGLAGWGLTMQLNGLVKDLPRYRVNFVAKLNELRAAGEATAVDELTKTIEDVQHDLAQSEALPARESQPVVLSQDLGGYSMFSWLGPLVGIAGACGIVSVLVIFMLLERRDLRDRLIKVVGRGHLALTTKALTEAGDRVARQLLMQTFVNGIYGIALGVGLYLLHVPYPLFWATLGGALRFIPYVGPLIGAGAPIVISVAAMDGWSGPLLVVGLVVALELFTNLVLETVLYAGSMGVTQVGLLVSIMFWTWLWGPLGLLMATPLTVCLVVLGNHVKGLAFLSSLMGDSPPLSASQGYYQRLLARDTGEAVELVERHVKTAEPRSVYDGLIVPALNRAELDRLEERLTLEEEKSLFEATKELLPEVAAHVQRIEAATPRETPARTLPDPLRILGYSTTGESGVLALQAFAQILDDLPIALEIGSSLLASEIVTWARENAISVVCIADLPPNGDSRVRHLVKKLRAAAPDLRIMVGRWAPPSLADESGEALTAAGANHVGSTLEASRAYLQEAVALLATAAPAPAVEAEADAVLELAPAK